MNWQVFLGDHPYSVEGRIVTFNAIESESTALAVAKWIVHCRTPKIHPEIFDSVVVQKVEPTEKEKRCILCGQTKI